MQRPLNYEYDLYHFKKYGKDIKLKICPEHLDFTNATRPTDPLPEKFNFPRLTNELITKGFWNEVKLINAFEEVNPNTYFSREHIRQIKPSLPRISDVEAAEGQPSPNPPKTPEFRLDDYKNKKFFHYLTLEEFKYFQKDATKVPRDKKLTATEELTPEAIRYILDNPTRPIPLLKLDLTLLYGVVFKFSKPITKVLLYIQKKVCYNLHRF